MNEPICRLTTLLQERPVAAFVAGRQVALVRLHDDRVYAVGMWDPHSNANVMARGLVGSKTIAGEEVPVIISPMYKQAFDLRTGMSVEDPAVSLGSWAVEVHEGHVHLGEQVSPELPGRTALDLAKAG